MGEASPPSTKTRPQHSGQEGSTDFTGSTVKMEAWHGTRKSKACRAARFVAFVKIELAGYGSALRREYPDSIRKTKPSETMTYPMGCKATNLATVVIKAEMGRFSSVAAMGLMHSSPK